MFVTKVNGTVQGVDRELERSQIHSLFLPELKYLSIAACRLKGEAILRNGLTCSTAVQLFGASMQPAVPRILGPSFLCAGKSTNTQLNQMLKRMFLFVFAVTEMLPVRT